MFQTILSNVRAQRPLVHCITNYVTVNDCANMVLACGASPIMADEPEEAAEIIALCQALTVNIGTLNRQTIPAMYAAARQAKSLGHPAMGQITGTGCQLSTLTAAFLAANPDAPLEAAVCAVCAMGLCGELSHARLTARDGNATYRDYILDAMCNLTPAQLESGANYEVR